MKSAFFKVILNKKIFISRKGWCAVFFQKLSQFMYGRYGSDKFNIFLFIFGILISLIGQLLGFTPVILFSYVFYIYGIFRMFSRNTAARQKELLYFLKVWTPVEKWFKIRKMIWSDRKTYKYFKCPNCKQRLRAPRGRGKIQVNCQKCHKEFIKKV